MTKTVTITEPPGNVAPNPVINPPSCAGLTCNFSAVGTVDPNTGDTITYPWDFGDPTDRDEQQPDRVGDLARVQRPGTYTVTLTATDGWGKSARSPET